MAAEIVNEVTGEALLTDKAGREYHVVFDMSAVMALEKITGRTVVEIISDPGMTGCVAMIMAGAAGWQRRQPGGPKVNGNLAQKILTDSGGVAKCGPVLAESLSCAEGLGFNDDAGGDDDTSPLGSTSS